MKLIRSNDPHGRSSVWLGIFSSLLITSSALQAAPGGGGGFGMAAGSANGPGAAASGGGHGGAVSGGSRGAAVSSGAHASLGGARPSAGGLGGSPVLGRGAQSGFAGGSNFNGTRTSVANTTGLGNRFTSASTTGRYTAPQTSGNIGAYRTGNTLPARRAVQSNNLWTDRNTAAPQATVSRGTLAARQGVRGSYSTGNPNYSTGSYTGRGGSYTTLYPGAYGYNSRSYNDTRSIPAGARGNQGNDNGGYRHGGRFNHYNVRNYYYPYYGYGYNYFPLLGSYGYYGGYTGLDNGYTGLNNGYATDNSLVPAPGLGSDTPNNNGTVQPYIQDNGVNPPEGGSPAPADQAAPTDEARPPVANQQPPAPATSRGPDSLVEAVQSELSNRGYYKGKVDSMFNDDTKEAIRKFQSDNQLAVTGLLNNATLMMLGLN